MLSNVLKFMILVCNILKKGYLKKLDEIVEFIIFVLVMVKFCCVCTIGL